MRSTEISGVYMVFCGILKKIIYVCFFGLVFCASAYSKGKPWLATENGAGSLWGHTLMEAYGGVLSYYKGLGYTVKNNGCQKVSGTRFDCSFDHSKEGSHRAYDVVTMLHLYGDACPPKMILDDSTGICISQKNTGMESLACSSPSKLVGNPIDFFVGNKHQVERDFEVSTSDLGFSRYYNSFDSLWKSSLSDRLIINDWLIVLVEGNGRESYFQLSDAAILFPTYGMGRLRRDGDSWVYTSSDNSVKKFSGDGYLVSTTLLSGELIEFEYKGDEVHVVSSSGLALTYAESVDHQPKAMRANGVLVQYKYDDYNRLVSVYKMADGQSQFRQYHYEHSGSPNLLTGVTDERGVRYATWSYDAKGRAISSEHAGGADRVEIAYNDDGSSTVTNELGKKATYRFQTIQGIKRITAIEGEPSPNCPNSNSTFTYDDRGLLKTKIDNKGIVTTYDYNARGLEVSRTEASGTPQARTVTTEWHPSRYLPLAVTEPDRITRYQYDDQGRQLSRTVENR